MFHERQLPETLCQLPVPTVSREEGTMDGRSFLLLLSPHFLPAPFYLGNSRRFSLICQSGQFSVNP